MCAAAPLWVGSCAAAGAPPPRAPLHALAPAADSEAPGHVVLRGPDVTDPFMMRWEGRDYIYASQGTSFLNVPMRVGRRPGAWGHATDVLNHLPAWAAWGGTWAPDVHRVVGGWALYFSAYLRGVSPPTHCIGSAFGPSPAGPFVAARRPMVCQLEHRGSIDARVVADGSRLVMLWKSEDNANPMVPGPDQDGRTGIYAQRLSGNGRVLLGRPVEILRPTQPWEGTIVEAPDMVEARGTYWLFFSGNWYNQPSYGIGVAACTTPLGPCTDARPGPLLGSNQQGSGPGEESLFHDGREVDLLYNPFRADDPGPVIPRPVMLAGVGFGPAGPYLAVRDA